MTLHDDAFSGFALGIIPIAAIILAISGAAVIFLLDRRHETELGYFEQVRLTATALHRFLANHVDSTANYVVSLDSYRDFAVLISTLGLTISTEQIPNYICWRTRTAEVASVSVEIASKIKDSNEKKWAGIPTQEMAEEEMAFHSGFGELMQSVDTSIQNFDWAANSRSIGLHRTFLLGVVAAVTLMASAVISLSSLIKSENGVADYWNIVGAVFLIGLIILLFALLYRCYLVFMITKQEWIDERIEVLRASMKPNS